MDRHFSDTPRASEIKVHFSKRSLDTHVRRQTKRRTFSVSKTNSVIVSTRLAIAMRRP